jgi:hypothetical protein
MDMPMVACHILSRIRSWTFLKKNRTTSLRWLVLLHQSLRQILKKLWKWRSLQLWPLALLAAALLMNDMVLLVAACLMAVTTTLALLAG